MQDIKALLVATLGADTTLRTLLGWTATDPRLYPYYKSEAEVNSAKPAFITYAQVAGPESSRGVSEPVYSFLVWGRTWATVESVGVRVKTLLHKQTLATSGGRTLYCKIVMETDSFQEQPDFAGKTLQVRAAWLSLGT